jgi:hypothetical protein
MAIGLLAGLGGNAVALVLPEPQRTVLAGTVLAAVGGVYLGFAVADGRASAIVVQAVSFVAFALVAFVGIYLDSRVLIGAGWIAHGVWDGLHYEGHGPTRVRRWYPPFCLVADVVVGLPLVAGL